MRKKRKGRRAFQEICPVITRCRYEKKEGTMAVIADN